MSHYKNNVIDLESSMPRFSVAHVREQGVNLIIVPLDDSYGRKQSPEQEDILDELQSRANNAGLAGTVVPVWSEGRGRMGFRAPQNWHPFLRSLNLSLVQKNLNKEIYW